MIVFPAIDLIQGQVVRLRQGERQNMRVYDHDPQEVAKRFADAGATWIHVVNLSAALGETHEAQLENLRAIERLGALDELSMELGGGVRRMEDLERLFSLGADRVSLGTAIVRSPAFARRACERYGEALSADVAALGDVVRVDGWRKGAGQGMADVCMRARDQGFRHMVFTNVERDGTRAGIEVEPYRRVAELVEFPVVASGGVACLDDIRALAALGPEVLEGVIVGSALYEGTVDLAEAIAVMDEA